MKYRVMASDGTVTDFEKDKETEARTLFVSKKKMVEKAEIPLGDRLDIIVPFCSLHRCYHDEAPPGHTKRLCEPIEQFKKSIQVRSIEER